MVEDAIYMDDDYDNYNKSGNTQLSLEQFGAIIPKSDIDYTPIELATVQEDLAKKSNDLINKLVDVYYHTDETTEEIQKYVEQIKVSEANSYKNLLFQTRATEHMIQSLLERLNSSGSMDNSLYKLLMEIIRESNVLTMQVSNYVRNLPQTFKTLKYELETQFDMVHIDKTDEMISEDADENPEDFIKRPQRGMREMLKMAEEMMEENHEDNAEILADDSNIPTADTEKYKTDTEEEMELLKQMQQDNE